MSSRENRSRATQNIAKACLDEVIAYTVDEGAKDGRDEKASNGHHCGTSRVDSTRRRGMRRMTWTSDARQAIIDANHQGSAARVEHACG